MKAKMLGVICGTMLLSGCAQLEAIQQQIIHDTCNQPAAYNAGMRDGLRINGKPAWNYASICPANQKIINAAYNRGFTEGLRNRPKQVLVEKNVNRQVNINKNTTNVDISTGKHKGKKHKK